MKIIVVGASGLVGQSLFNYLEKLGVPVVGTQNRSNRLGLLRYDILQQSIKDVLPLEFTRSADRLYGVICTKFGRMDDYVRNDNRQYQLETKRIITLIQELVEIQVIPVFLSTNAVFEGDIGFYNEKDKRHPVSHYGKHMLKVEEYIMAYAPTTMILRLSNVVSSNINADHIFSDWHDRLSRRVPIDCIEGQIFSPTFVDDIARAIYISCKSAYKGVYHIASNGYGSRRDLANLFRSVLGINVPIVCRPQSELNILDPRPLKGHLDSSRFMRISGMKYTPMDQIAREINSRYPIC